MNFTTEMGPFLFSHAWLVLHVDSYPLGWEFKKKNQARRLIYTRSLVGIKGGTILWMQMCWTFETSCLHVSHIYVLLPTSASFCFSFFLTLFSRIFADLKFLCMESYTCFRATSNMNLMGITWELCCKVVCITTLTTRSGTRKERKGQFANCYAIFFFIFCSAGHLLHRRHFFSFILVPIPLRRTWSLIKSHAWIPIAAVPFFLHQFDYQFLLSSHFSWFIYLSFVFFSKRPSL